MPLSGKELVKLFQKNGWYIERIKGSHYIMVHRETNQTVPIPVHANRSLGKGLERAILKKMRIQK